MVPVSSLMQSSRGTDVKLWPSRKLITSSAVPTRELTDRFLPLLREGAESVKDKLL